MPDAALILAIIVSITALVGQVISVLILLRKNNREKKRDDANGIRARADASETDADTELKLLPAYKTEVKSLREEVTRASNEILSIRTQIYTLQAEIRIQNELIARYKVVTDKLVSQLELHGIIPIVKPPDYVG